MKFLATRANVYLAFLAEETPTAETMAALGGLCKEVVGISLGPCRRRLHAAWSLASGGTATEGMFQSGQLRQRVADWTATVRFDAAVAYCSSMVQYLDVPGLQGVPALVDLVDVDSQKWLQYGSASHGMRRAFYTLEGRRLRRLESSLPDRVAAITLVSAAEADLYRSFCATDLVHAVPNGVDMDYFRPAPTTNGQGTNGCVFVGALDYRANIEGVAWFCSEIWPAVRRQCADATFTIVGSRPGPAIRGLTQIPGVRVAGDVPDVRPYLTAAALVVVPLRIARGLQNKVLEALALSKAVLATPQALEGLAVEPDVHACCAVAPAEWSAKLISLLGDEPWRRRLGQAGRSYVEAHHCWDHQLQPLTRLLHLTPDGCANS